MNIIVRLKKLRHAVALTFVLSAATMVAHADQPASLMGPPAPVDAIAAASVFVTETPAPDISILTIADFTPTVPAAIVDAKPLAAAPRPTIKPQSYDTAIALSGDQAARYKKIFALQAASQWDQADDALDQITDTRLKGSVLAQRYMTPAYHASYQQLANWLDLYADQPAADRIHTLAELRRPAGDKTALRQPANGDGITGYLDTFSDRSDAYASPRQRGKGQQKDIDRLTDAVHAAMTKGAASTALSVLSHDAAGKLLDDVEYDQLRAQIASSYLYSGKSAQALTLAAASAARSGNKAPLAGWTGGLAAWQHKNYKQAAGLFEQAANSPYSSSWTTAAASYWAYRAHSRAGDVAAANTYLERAASYPRTFYGLIALRSLNRDIAFHWDMPILTPALTNHLKSIPAGARAIALVASGQIPMAEAELRQINPGNDKVLAQALLAYANQAGLPALAMRLAEALPHPGGGLYDAALYPLSPWQPQNGYKIDRALINAIVRQESCFDPAARSHSGATGLMQLMPDTATAMASTSTAAGLRDPEINLDIGQRYVAHLLDQEPISTELFSLVVAYNAGPGNLRKWKDATAAVDPLLFLETIPVAETRTFAEKVMSNYWIYRLRLHQPTPSLDSVADGHWAQYVSLDAPAALVVADAN